MSRFFTLDEMLFSETATRLKINNAPGQKELANLERLMLTMDQVREYLDAPVIVSSGYRSPELNKTTKGSKTSAHMRGLACDFRCPAYGTPLMVAQALAKSGIVFDQLIHEFGSWVHLGLSEEAPRGQLLTINKKGTFAGLK